MKHIYLCIILCAFSIGSLLFHSRDQLAQPIPTESLQTPAKVQQQALQVDRMLSTQQRLNRYFHYTVMPKLKACWSSLRGSGTIEFKHSFKKNSTKWVADKVEIESSTLPEGQQPIALKCMQVATGGTSFSATDSERTARDYVMYWTWPVPFPPNANELTRIMFARRPKTGGGSGCDSRGSRPRCWSCSDTADCIKTCTGSLDCAKGLDSCVAFGACAAGGAFTLGGGTVIQ